MTGGAGYIGSISVETLIAAGHDVVVLDDLSTGHRSAIPPGAGLIEGSYADIERVARLLTDERIDAILHCGARSLVGESIADPARYYRANIVGGVALLDAARQAGVQRFVFSSSAAVYGTPEVAPIAESAPLRPINPYGETKRTFESALAWYGSAYGLRSVSLRYFNAAGASADNGEDHDPETHLIPNVLRAAEGTAEVAIFGDDYPTADGTCVRDYIHVEDLAAAHLLALEATAGDRPAGDRPAAAEAGNRPAVPEAGDLPGWGSDRRRNALVCNLGSGTGFSVRQVIDAAAGVVGHAIPTRIGPRRAGDPPVLIASAGRAESLLGWQARHGSLEEMIGSAWEWRRRHPHGYPG
ncbi:MAG TPA: UDP-glucose 4-epimerase GalE [Candidatus Saccharimonadales bacterium]|nr:UDP-glucose 4-epimerase GalE [Candidatus Saccharimonadales bacterium]